VSRSAPLLKNVMTPLSPVVKIASAVAEAMTCE